MTRNKNKYMVHPVERGKKLSLARDAFGEEKK